MGLFDFMKEAGEKAAKAALEAKDIENNVKKLDLEVSDLNIELDGDKAIIKGKATSQSAFEKLVLAAGNIAGISAVDAQIDVAEAAPEAVFYTVKRGDNLSKISKKHLGSANRYNEIFEANKPMLSHPDKIYPGQVLRIPA